MRLLFTSTFILLFSLFLHGCSSHAAVDHAALSSSRVAELSAGAVSPRKEIIEASITLTAEDTHSVLQHVSAIVSALNGYIENSSQGEKRTYLRVRIPKDAIDAFFQKLESVGEVTDKTISRMDVTEQHADVIAKIENLKSLRSRYRQLLDKASDVKDMLEIERELNRVQFELDQLEGQLKNLNQRIEYATVTVTVKKKTVLGPVGWVFKVTADVLGKLIIWK